MFRVSRHYDWTQIAQQSDPSMQCKATKLSLWHLCTIRCFLEPAIVLGMQIKHNGNFLNVCHSGYAS
ncbi:hypothetical protein SAMN05192544_102582 [Paraburkholderia hospita]|nr:hypothetical protein SAMN05192544_102582 [Paraburkholderia hospita]